MIDSLGLVLVGIVWLVISVFMGLLLVVELALNVRIICLNCWCWLLKLVVLTWLLCIRLVVWVLLLFVLVWISVGFGCIELLWFG